MVSGKKSSFLNVRVSCSSHFYYVNLISFGFGLLIGPNKHSEDELWEIMMSLFSDKG